MLDHFHREHDIEALTRIGQRLRGGNAIIDGNLALLGMQICGRDVLLRRVSTEHARTKTSQRLGQNSAAAADIEDTQAF